MKKCFFAFILTTSSIAHAYDANLVHKFSCNGGTFFGVLLSSSGADIPYIPVSVNGTFCTVYPNTRLIAGGINCMGLRIESIGMSVSQCSRGN